VKQFIEMRGADMGDRAHALALPAFWTGLLYGALDGAWDLVRGLDAETREGLRVAASERALGGEAGGVRLQGLAREAVALADEGLRARGLGEEALLDPLRRSVETGRTQADDLLAAYEGEWGGDVAGAYGACRL
jgi:glutamate--cysteine ligase